MGGIAKIGGFSGCESPKLTAATEAARLFGGATFRFCFLFE